jgi:hypothetical protein
MLYKWTTNVPFASFQLDPPSVVVRGIDGSAADDFWVVGDIPGEPGAVVFRRKDGAWHLKTTGCTYPLRDVVTLGEGDTDDVLAVGDGGVILRRRRPVP